MTVLLRCPAFASRAGILATTGFSYGRNGIRCFAIGLPWLHRRDSNLQPSG
jgi:hypothetical protein